MIKIDKNVPIPQGSGAWRKYPAKEMKKGDSFFIADVTTREVGGAITRFRQQVPGSAWTTRTVTESGRKGTRVWRVE